MKGDHGNVATSGPTLANVAANAVENRGRITELEDTIANPPVTLAGSAATETPKEGTTLDLNDLSQMLVTPMVSALQSALQQQNNNSRGDRNNGQGRGRGGGNRNYDRNAPRQYNFYCHSRGVNLFCSGKNCKPHCNRGPNHDPNATEDERNGGSEKFLDKWNMWYNPTDGKTYRDEACTQKFE